MQFRKEIGSICRTCGLENGETVPICKRQTLGNAEMVISDVNSKCSSVQVQKGADLPQQMCKKCSEEPNTTFSSKSRCEEVYSELPTSDNGIYRTDVQMKTENSVSEKKDKDEMETIELKQEAEYTLWNQEIDSSTLIKVEEEKIHLNVVASYSCNECNIIYDGLASLQTHNSIKHVIGNCTSEQRVANDEKSKKKADVNISRTFLETSITNEKCSSEENEDEPKGIGSSEKTTYKCNLCPKKFKLKSYLCEHQKRHVNTCNVRKKSLVSGTYLKQHMSTHITEKLFGCQICDRTFGTKAHLKEHIKTHAVEKPFKCGICDYVCVRNSNMKQHAKIHAIEKPLKCDVCDYRCVRRSLMKQHAITHTGEKPFKCDICDRGFISKRNLQVHVTIHTGEQLKCDVCDYSCTIRLYMTQHMKKHMTEKPFKCDVCGHGCVHKRNLKQHMMTHTIEKPFKCDVCDHGFTWKKNLKVHMKSHTGFKRFQCDVCDYDCIQKGNLKVHKMTHTADKPFKCETCDYSTVYGWYMKQHVKTHAAEKPFKCAICDYACIQLRTLKDHMLRHDENDVQFL